MTNPCTYPECSRPAVVGNHCGLHRFQSLGSATPRRFAGRSAKLMRLPEMRVSESCLKQLEAESDRTGRSIYEIARGLIEEWVKSRPVAS